METEHPPGARPSSWSVLLAAALAAGCAARQPCAAMESLDEYRTRIGQEQDDPEKWLARCIEGFEQCAEQDGLTAGEQAGLAFCKAALAYERGNTTEASSIVDLGLAEHDGEVLLHHLRTHLAVSADDPDTAVTSAQREVELAPEWPWAWLDLALAYIHAESFTEAESAVLSYLERAPDSAMAYSMLGMVRLKLGVEPQIWLGNMRRAAELAPDDPTYLMDLYQVLVQMATLAPEGAFAHGDLLAETEQSLADMFPGEPDLLVQMAYQRFQIGHDGRARELILAALSLAPDHPAALAALVGSCAVDGDCASVEGRMQEAADLPVDVATDIIAGYAEALVDQDEDEMACRWAKKALVLDPDMADMHLLLAGAYADQCRMAEALDQASLAAELAPEDPVVLMGQGMVLTQADELEQAMANADKIESLVPDSPMGSVLASQVLYQQGRWQESLEPIEEAIELLPGWTELSVQLADTLFMMDELDRAVAVLEEACAEPGDAEVSCLVLGGTLEAAQGRPAEGFALTGEAIAREPDNANLYIYHAWVMAQLEKRGEAEKGGARDVFMEGIGMRPSMATKPWVLELKKDIPGLKNKTLEEGPLDPCD